MAINAQALAGTPASAALMHPWIAPAHFNIPGMPLGPDMRTGELVTLDPWIGKASDLFHSTVFAVLGEKNSGKTTAMKSLVLRLMALQAGRFDGVVQRMRARINDRKPEDGRPEYTVLTEFLESKVVALARQRINIFDPAMNMTEWDLLETATNVCEFVNGGQPLRHFQPLALQVAMFRMRQQFGPVVSPEVLEAVLRGLSMQDLEEYFNNSNNTLLDTFGKTLHGRPELGHQMQLMFERPHNVTEQEFLQDAAQVSAYLLQLLRGEFGHMFGGEHSLRETLTQPVVTLDWTDVNPKSRTLLQALIWKWQTVALNRNDLGFIPHINISDEEHEAMSNLMYVRFRAAYVKKARAFHTTDIIGTQYRLDFKATGDEGSEIRELASNIVKGIGCYFVGKQPNDPAILDDLATLGISDHDLDALTKLPTGCFGLKVPDRKIIFFQYVLTPTELALVQSNAAARRMVDRIPVMDSPDVQRRLAQAANTGVNLVEVPHA